MTDQELIAVLRTRVAYHEREAERCRRMLALAEDDGPGTPAPARGPRAGKREAGSGKRAGKGGRVSSAPRPTQAKGAGGRLPPEQHPKYGEARKLSEGGMTLPAVAAAVGLPLTTVRNWRARGGWK